MSSKRGSDTSKVRDSASPVSGSSKVTSARTPPPATVPSESSGMEPSGSTPPSRAASVVSKAAEMLGASLTPVMVIVIVAVAASTTAFSYVIDL